MRILLTTDTVGGVWTFTCQLVAQLLARGHAVALVSFGREPDAAQRAWCTSQAAKTPRAFRFQASEVPLEWMPDNESAFAGDAVLQAVDADFGADLLHSSQFCFGASAFGLPRVVTAHSDVLSWAQAAKPEGLEDSLWLRQYCHLVQTGLTHADAVVAPTHAMLAALAQGFRLSHRATVVLNGMEFTPPATSRRKLQAVSAGRFWDPAKGLALLQELDAPMPILVAGDTDNSASTRVRSLGKLPHAQLQAVFAESSVYLATSLYEPFGLAPLEAALCGCAVVARDLPSLREVWGDGALFFDTRASLEATLRPLCADPNLLASARKRSTTRAAELTASRMCEGYLAVYDQALASRPAARSFAHA